MPISIHTIRAAEPGPTPYVDVDIEGWGEVRVRRLPKYEQEPFAALFSGATTDGLLALVCACAVDDGGVMLFSTPEDIALLEANKDALDKLAAAAVALHADPLPTAHKPAQLEALVPDATALHK